MMAVRKQSASAVGKTRAAVVKEVAVAVETIPAEAAQMVAAEEVIPAAVEQEQIAAVETIRASVEQGTKIMSEQFGISQTKVKEGMEKAIKTTEEMVAFSQGNMEAFVKSSQILATGLQDLSKELAATAQASVEEAVSTFKAFSGVKSLKDALDLHSATTKASMEKAIAHSSKLTDASVKLAELAFAPLTQRFTLAAEKFTKAV